MSLRLLPRLRLAARPSVPVRRAAAAVPAARALSASAVARAQAGAREADDERVDADPYELVDSHRRMGADGREPNDPQLGDYPELPFASLQRRRYDPSWWDAQEKRNFGETVSPRARGAAEERRGVPCAGMRQVRATLGPIAAVRLARARTECSACVLRCRCSQRCVSSHGGVRAVTLRLAYFGILPAVL